MSDTYSQFQIAARRMHASPVAKVFRPGLQKFLIRYWATRLHRTTPITAQLFFGERMQVVLPEVVSQAIYTYGLFDESVTDFVIRQVKPGDVVLDIGAHFGYISLLCSHLVGTRGLVYAFEPTPSTYAVLAENSAGRKNMVPLNLAAGREDAELDISDYGLQYCAWNTLANESRMPEILKETEVRKIKVNVVVLDRFLAGKGIKPTFIKIDAENFEADVIAGLEQTLKIARPVVLMEAGSAGSLQAAESLVSHGYRLHVADRPGVVVPWMGALNKANNRFKDILFLP